MNRLPYKRKSLLIKTKITRLKVYLISAVLLVLIGGCNKEDSTEVPPQLNNIAVEPSPPASSPEEMDARLGLRHLKYANDAPREKITVGEIQFSDESLIVNLEAIIEEGTQFNYALWYQLTGPESVIVTPEKVQTQVVLPAVNIESTLTYRFVIVTDTSEVLYQDTSIVVLPSERKITIQPATSNEVSSSQTFNISIGNALDSDLELLYSTHPLTADQNDFESISNTVTLPAGEVSIDVEIPVVNDLVSEETEFYYLNIVSSDGSYAARAIGVIIDNETPVYNGTSYANTDDFALDVPQDALIAIDCDSPEFIPTLTSVCSSVDSSCEGQTEIASVTERENEKILALDELSDGNYRLSVKNESGALNSCNLTALWRDLAKEYTAKLSEGEWFYMDFSLAGEKLKASKPIGVSPPSDIGDAFEISLLEATSSSLNLTWPAKPGATIELYMGSATERTLHSTTTENSILIESLTSGANYCFHAVVKGLTSTPDFTSGVFCTQVPVEIAGALEFQLSWTYDAEDKGPDLDLHVTDPEGKVWYYANAISSTANPNLDIDDTGTGNGGPERMYWENPLSGAYQYRVDWFSTGSSQLTYADYTLRVYAGESLVAEKQGRLAAGADSEVFTFEY